MRKTDHHAVRALFERALEIPPGERADFLERECREDPSSKELVLALLEADGEAGSFLERCSFDVPEEQGDEFVPGELIGPYRLVERLGEGGIGAVWKAEQESPVRRFVALKVLKLGMDSQAVIARFEAERQALAMMDHPFIARVFDADTTDAGRPYFVMELVPGLSITTYCDERGLDTESRLRLFVGVCEAVEHAHCKGIIHRDLKPANVLVAEVDGRAAPKVIDFGIAKATRMRLTEHTLATASGQLLGTPRYMSPEQADLQDVDVDTRSDVYALGALLHELLTGRPALDVDVAQVGYMELLRAVREDPPPRPSATDPRLRGDLDTIVLKALAKERDARYSTAGGLARDVERFLAHEPIEARRPTALYQLGKLARRHRLAVGAGLTVLVVLIVATAVSSLLAVRASEARDEATAKASALEDAQLSLRAARDDAQARARELEEQQARLLDVVQFHAESIKGVNVGSMGAQIEEQVARSAGQAGADAELVTRLEGEFNGADLARRLIDEQILGRLAGTIDTDFGDDVATAAELEASIATAYRQLGLFDRAMEHVRRAHELFREAYGEGHEETWKTFGGIAVLTAESGRLVEAEPLYEEAYARSMEHLGPDHEVTISALNNLSWLAQALGRPQRAHELAVEAEQRYRRVLGDDHKHTIMAIGNLGVSEKERGGDYERALELMRESWEGLVRLYGPRHTGTLTMQSNIALLLDDLGRPDAAEQAWRELVPVLQEAHGDRHPETLEALSRLGAIEVERGQLEEGLEHVRAAARGLEATLGPDSERTLEVRTREVEALRRSGRLDEALALADEVLGRADLTLGPEAATRVVALHELALTLAALGERETAIDLLEEVVGARRRNYGDRHARTAIAMCDLGAQYVKAGRLDDAEEILGEALSVQEEALGPDSVDGAITLRWLARVADERGDPERAGRLAVRAARAIDGMAGADPVREAQQRRYQANLALELGDYEQAEAHLLKARGLLVEQLPEEDPRVVEVQAVLEELHQARDADAPSESALDR